MKVPVISAASNHSNKKLNKKHSMSFHGRVDTEMRNILVDRTIFGTVGHSGYTTYYCEEPVGNRVDELNRMVNIYRPYSWEQEHYGAPWGTMECTKFKELPYESMEKIPDPRYSYKNPRESAPKGYRCVKPEPTGERIPDYIEKDEFRLTVPINYTSDGRPIYKTGETLYIQRSFDSYQLHNFDFYNADVKEDRTEIWEGAIGIIGKPLTREESLKDKLTKLTPLKEFYEKQKRTVNAKYDNDIDVAYKKSSEALLESTRNYNKKIATTLYELQGIKNKNNIDVLERIKKEEQELKEEIKLIEDAKRKGRYLDISTKEKYEDFLKNDKKLYKYETIVSLPMGTVQIPYFYSKDTRTSEEGMKDFKKNIEPLFSPEKHPLIMDLMHSDSRDKNNFVEPCNYRSSYIKPKFKLHK